MKLAMKLMARMKNDGQKWIVVPARKEESGNETEFKCGLNSDWMRNKLANEWNANA